MIPLSTSSARVRSHSAGHQPLPRVDYSKSMQDVFIDAAWYTVLERQDLIVWCNERVSCAKRIRVASGSRRTTACASDGRRSSRARTSAYATIMRC